MMLGTGLCTSAPAFHSKQRLPCAHLNAKICLGASIHKRGALCKVQATAGRQRVVALGESLFGEWNYVEVRLELTGVHACCRTTGTTQRCERMSGEAASRGKLLPSHNPREIGS